MKNHGKSSRKWKNTHVLKIAAMEDQELFLHSA